MPRWRTQGLKTQQPSGNPLGTPRCGTARTEVPLIAPVPCWSLSPHHRPPFSPRGRVPGVWRPAMEVGGTAPLPRPLLVTHRPLSAYGRWRERWCRARWRRQRAVSAAGAARGAPERPRRGCRRSGRVARSGISRAVRVCLRLRTPARLGECRTVRPPGDGEALPELFKITQGLARAWKAQVQGASIVAELPAVIGLGSSVF